jgi:hypothetical protein
MRRHLVANEKGNTSGTRFWDRWFRERLATIVLLVSVLAVAILAGIAIRVDRSQAKEILTMSGATCRVTQRFNFSNQGCAPRQISGCSSMTAAWSIEMGKKK